MINDSIINFLRTQFSKKTPPWQYFGLEPLAEVIDGITYTEQWRTIPVISGLYEISSFGRIRTLSKPGANNSIKKQKIFKQQLNKNGYLQVRLTLSDGNKISTTMHRLVAIAFIDNPLFLREVNHFYSLNKQCNYSWNLQWSSSLDNKKHGYENGVMKKGEENHFAKLDKDAVLSIIGNNSSASNIGKKFGVSKSAIIAIKSGKSWAAVSGIEFNKKMIPNKIDKRQTIEIFTSKESTKILATKYEISEDYIRRIRRKRVRKRIINEYLSHV